MRKGLLGGVAVGILLFAPQAFSYADGCGRYNINGVIRKTQRPALTLVVNEGTASEIRLEPSERELDRFVGYLDVPVELQARVVKLDGTRGVVSSPVGLRLRVPDPLRAGAQSNFRLLEKLPCDK